MTRWLAASWAALMLAGLVLIVVGICEFRKPEEDEPRPPDVDPCEMTGGANIKVVDGWTYICHKDYYD